MQTGGDPNDPDHQSRKATCQNMSTLEQDLKKQILGRSKAEKTFRPWWDTLEDYLLNSLVLLGFLTLPTAYVTGNPVECVVHPDLWNKTDIWDPLGVGKTNVFEDQYEEEYIGYPIETVRITHWYVKRYCTEKFVSKFVFYFPYILLIVPLTLVLVDRIFIKTFAAGNKIKQFYELLVEDSLRREDVDSLSRENMKNLHEIMQSFRFSNVCYWSYLSRTCLEIVLSIGLFLIYFCWGMPNLEREIDCNVHGIRHTCVLPNHQFYFYILTVSIALLCVYILCNFYNLIWIVCPQMGKMYRIICKYQEIVDPNLNQHISTAAPNLIKYKNNIASADEVTIPLAPGLSKPVITNHNFLAVYFDHRHKDLKLLLNLLAETSGLPESFRILTLFDKKFQSLWKPQNLRFEEYETVLPNRTVKSRSIIVRWNDAPIGKFITGYNGALAFEYTIDITPAPANEFGLKSVLFKKDNVNNGCAPNSNDIEGSKVETCEKNFRYEVAFDNIITQEEEYTVTISTELNGRTVTQMVEKFPMGQQDDPLDST